MTTSASELARTIGDGLDPRDDIAGVAHDPSDDPRVALFSVRTQGGKLFRVQVEDVHELGEPVIDAGQREVNAPESPVGAGVSEPEHPAGLTNDDAPAMPDADRESTERTEPAPAVTT